MLNFIKILVLLPFLAGLCYCSKAPYQQWCEQAFRADSGIINRNQVGQLLHLICQNDPAVFTSEFCSFLLETSVAQDTPLRYSSGKYFRGEAVDGQRRWVLCLKLNLLNGDAHLVLEFGEWNDSFSLNSHGWFYHGNYGWCWEGEWEGFARIGPYFYLVTCCRGTGLGCSHANILFFPLSANVDNEATPPNIPLTWNLFYLQQEALTGRLSLRGDTIIADYTYQVDTLIENSQEEMIAHPLRFTRFTAKFYVDTERQMTHLLNCDSIRRIEGAALLFDCD